MDATANRGVNHKAVKSTREEKLKGGGGRPSEERKPRPAGGGDCALGMRGGRWKGMAREAAGRWTMADKGRQGFLGEKKD